MSAPTPHRAPLRALAPWAAASLALLAAWSLACGVSDPCAAGGCGEDLDADDLRALVSARAQLQGRWRIELQGQALDEVERPVPAGALRWTLEIFEVEVLSTTDPLLLRWNGALRAEAPCLVADEDFGAPEPPCQELGPAFMGRCAGHACARRDEQSISGRFTPDTGQFGFDAIDADHHFADPEQGFINLSAALSETLTFDGTERADNGGECTSRCAWSTSVRGPITGTYSNHSGQRTLLTMARLDDLVRPQPEVNAEETQVRLDTQEEAEAAVIGQWEVEVNLEREGEDGLQRAGQAAWTMDIFEVIEIGDVGSWQFKAGLTARDMCLNAPGQRTCTPQPATNGSCTISNGCAPGEEVAIVGFYNTIDGATRISADDAPLFIGRDGDFIALDIDLVLDGGVLSDDEVASTQCTSRCAWSTRSTGPLGESIDIPGGADQTLTMRRAPR